MSLAASDWQYQLGMVHIAIEMARGDLNGEVEERVMLEFDVWLMMERLCMWFKCVERLTRQYKPLTLD